MPKRRHASCDVREPMVLSVPIEREKEEIIDALSTLLVGEALRELDLLSNPERNRILTLCEALL